MWGMGFSVTRGWGAWLFSFTRRWEHGPTHGGVLTTVQGVCYRLNTP